MAGIRTEGRWAVPLGSVVVDAAGTVEEKHTGEFLVL